MWTFGHQPFSLGFHLFLGSLAIWLKSKTALSPNCTCNKVNIKPHEVKTSIWFLIVFMLEIWGEKSMETCQTSKHVCETVHSDLRSIAAKWFKATHISMHNVACTAQIQQNRYRSPALVKSWWCADKAPSFCSHRVAAPVLHVASKFDEAPQSSSFKWPCPLLPACWWRNTVGKTTRHDGLGFWTQNRVRLHFKLNKIISYKM